MSQATAPNRNYPAYATAFGLAAFSGSVATYGLTKFCPGAELVVAAMGILFECGKLTAFAMLHKKMPRTLKGALLTVGLVLMILNVVGVAGFLSNAYERQQIGARATSHTATATAHASADLVERQLASAESNLAQARTALVRARDDKGRVKAAQAVIASATAERDALVQKLSVAQASTAQVEGDTINSGAEFAAIQFLSGATGAGVDVVAHVVIMIVAGLPDILAVLLLLAAVRDEPKPVSAPIAKPVRKVTRKPRMPKRQALRHSPLRAGNDNVLRFPQPA